MTAMRRTFRNWGGRPWWYWRAVANRRARVGGGAIDLDAYMASLDRGFWYDLSKLDWHFQGPSGQVLASTIGNPLGLALDQRGWGGKTFAEIMSEQPEIAINGALSADTNWIKGAGVTITGGKAVFSSVGNGVGLSQAVATAFDTTKFYLGSVSMSAFVGGSLAFRCGTGGSFYQLAAANGNFSNIVPGGAASTTLAVPSNFAGSTFEIDNLSVKGIPGNSASQSNANYKPIRDAYGFKGDGSDDRVVTTYGLSGSGDVFAFDYVNVPETVGATQIFFGAEDGSGNGAYVGVTTAGELRVKVGQTVLDTSGSDLRNTRAFVGFFTVGSNIYSVINDAIVATGEWTGSLPTTLWNLWSLNANGTPSSFFAGSLFSPLTGRDTIDGSKARRIKAAMVALVGVAALNLTFGTGTDFHYSSTKANHDGLYLDGGLDKADALAAKWNAANVEFAMFGGDLVEGDGAASGSQQAADLADIVSSFAATNGPVHYCLGNHDFDTLTRAQVLSACGLESGHYSFDHKGVHFTVLDGNYFTTSDDSGYSAGSDPINTYINDSQRAWLAADLAATSLPTVVFVHQRADGSGYAYLINASDVRDIFEAAGNVMAVFQGHHHRNDLAYVNGIPYVTMDDGASDAVAGDVSGAVVHITAENLIINGFGTQVSQTIARRV